MESSLTERFQGASKIKALWTDEESARAYLASQEGLGDLFIAREDSIGDIQAESNRISPLEPYRPVATDLARLHVLARSRRAFTILEYGVGFSTLVLAHALAMNEAEFGGKTSEWPRLKNSYELHSVDSSTEWVQIALARLPAKLRTRVFFTVSTVRMTIFNGRICTEYENSPNVSPDLIYLDGPHPDSADGAINGISTREDRVPMACDILRVEHFLLPGTLIIVDGRTANARFLKTNLQRDWSYAHDESGDVHFFELREPPLGALNRSQLAFCLGEEWLSGVG